MIDLGLPLMLYHKLCIAATLKCSITNQSTATLFIEKEKKLSIHASFCPVIIIFLHPQFRKKLGNKLMLLGTCSHVAEICLLDMINLMNLEFAQEKKTGARHITQLVQMNYNRLYFTI
ncbi:hypothetical protein ACJX0J_011401 [Zea mays]